MVMRMRWSTAKDGRIWPCLSMDWLGGSAYHPKRAVAFEKVQRGISERPAGALRLNSKLTRMGCDVGKRDTMGLGKQHCVKRKGAVGGRSLSSSSCTVCTLAYPSVRLERNINLMTCMNPCTHNPASRPCASPSPRFPLRKIAEPFRAVRFISVCFCPCPNNITHTSLSVYTFPCGMYIHSFGM